jgi:ABC-2 type transport system ATP-binding protein
MSDCTTDRVPVRLERLCKSYGRVRALERLTLSVERGEIYGLLGPNGAGKTTALLCLAGLMRPDEGALRVAGVDVLARRREAAARLSLIPDRPHLPERLTVIEVGEYALGLRGHRPGEARRRFDPWLERFGLAGRRRALVAELSHGMRQKLVFCASLAAATPVLVIDEPMVGLDVPAQRLVIEVLREKAAAGDAMLITTHTLAVAERLCTRVGILDRGRLLEEGSPAALMEARRRPDLEEVFLELVSRDGAEDGFRLAPE